MRSTKLIKTGISRRIGRRNLDWEVEGDPDYDGFFKDAMELAQREFCDTLNSGESLWRARVALKEAVKRGKDNHDSGRVLVLIGKGSIWNNSTVL